MLPWIESFRVCVTAAVREGSRDEAHLCVSADEPVHGGGEGEEEQRARARAFFCCSLPLSRARLVEAGVSNESVGGQGMYTEVELIQHEEHRLARHAGKVVYEAPQESAAMQKQRSEPRHPTVKDATAAMDRHARSLYAKGLAEAGREASRRIVKGKEPPQEERRESSV